MLTFATLRTALATMWAVVATATTTIVVVVLTTLTLLLVLALGNRCSLLRLYLRLLLWCLLATALMSMSSALAALTIFTTLALRLR